MFSFFKKKEKNNRDLFRARLKLVLDEIYDSDDHVQITIGKAIYMADAIFQQTFPTPDDFVNLPHNAKLEYLNQFSTARMNIEEKTGSKLYALGFEIYEMWLGIVSVKDKALFYEFVDDITFFCDIGEEQ